jgi:soluble lytic murein transglycosylase
VSRFSKHVGATLIGIVAGCGGTDHVPARPSASTGASSADPVASEAPSASSGAPVASAPPYDASKLAPILDDARLVDAKALSTKGKHRDAAKTVEAVAPAQSDADRALFWYVAARERELAGDPAGVARDLDECAKIAGPIAPWARFGAAEKWIALSEWANAVADLEAIPESAIPRAKSDPLRAKALLRAGRVEDGLTAYRDVVARHDKTWAASALELAHALLDHPGGARADEAARLSLDVSLDGPTSRDADAKSTLDKALSTMSVEARKPFDAPSDAELASRGARLVASGRGKQALAIATKLEKKKDASCGSVALHARALAAVGRASEAIPFFEAAIRACAGDASVDGAKLLFDAGKAGAKGGNLEKAVGWFEMLEKDHPESSLADDARIERAKAARDDKDRAAFVKALSTIATDYPNGDLSGDGLFLLVVELAKDGSWRDAIAPLRAGAALEKERAYYRAGRFQYFLGRALAESADATGARAAFVKVLEDYPLSYYAALACARLDEAVSGSCKEAFDGTKPAADPAGPTPAILSSEPWKAAEILVALDDGRMALVALDTLGVGDRTAAPETTLAAAMLLAKTSPTLAHLVLRSASEYEPRSGRKEAVAYRDAPPLDAWKSVWEAAYPRPFAEAAKLGATESGVTEPLLFAIMREESAFEPGAISKAGAIGLTQIMPATASKGAKRLGLPGDDAAFHDPSENVRIGAHYLRQMRDRFSDDPLLAIPAYNAGPLKPEEWAGDRPGMAFDLFVEDMPFSETRTYTKRVIGSLFAYEVLGGGIESSEAGHTPLLARKAAP